MMTTTKLNMKHKNNNNFTDTESQTTICQVGYVFCSEEINDTTSLNRKNSARQIISFIDQLKDQVKAIQKKNTKQKKIKKVQIASWSKAEINRLKQLLRVYGTDFQSISIEMKKTRDQIKRKYKVLEKKSDDVVDCVFECSKQKSNQESKQSDQIDFQ